MADSSLKTNPLHTNDNIEKQGLAILRAKTMLVKPYSKHAEEGFRPRTPTCFYDCFKDDKEIRIVRTNPIFFTKPPIRTGCGGFRCYRQRQTDSVPMSHVRTGANIGNGTAFIYVTPQPYTLKVPDDHKFCTSNAFPKWSPDRAGERTLEHLHEVKPADRFAMVDMYRRPSTACANQIVFTNGRSNDGYNLPKYDRETTWFGGSHSLSRFSKMTTGRTKTTAEYEQEQSEQQDQYRKAKKEWPHLSEYGEQFVLKTPVERRYNTDLRNAKQYIARYPTRISSFHNELVAKSVAQGRTFDNTTSYGLNC